MLININDDCDVWMKSGFGVPRSVVLTILRSKVKCLRIGLVCTPAARKHQKL